VLVDIITGGAFGFSSCEIDPSDTVLSPARDVPLTCR
jgi:hypothetical protein